MRSLFLVLVMSVSAWAQSDVSCEHELALNVLLPDGRPVLGLQGDKVVAKTKGKVLAVHSLVYDAEPRRIFIVLDNHPKLPELVWQLETELILYLLEGAREQDSFALATARGGSLDLPFGTSHDALRAAITKLRSVP